MWLVCLCSSVCLTFQQFLQAAPHYVDVFDADKLEADVGVVVLVFVAFTCCPISQCIQLQDGGKKKKKFITSMQTKN